MNIFYILYTFMLLQLMLSECYMNIHEQCLSLMNLDDPLRIGVHMVKIKHPGLWIETPFTWKHQQIVNNILSLVLFTKHPGLWIQTPFTWKHQQIVNNILSLVLFTKHPGPLDPDTVHLKTPTDCK